MKKVAGFTLIELMIVIAIIAILVAIALPAYEEYQIRTKASEGLSVASAAKTAVAESANENGGIGNVTAANTAYSFTAASTKYVQSVVVSGLGVITVVTKNTGSTTPIEFVLRPAQNVGGNAIDWTCEGSGASKTTHYPLQCRP